LAEVEGFVGKSVILSGHYIRLFNPQAVRFPQAECCCQEIIKEVHYAVTVRVPVVRHQGHIGAAGVI
jgi:hypothetical protein